MSASSTSPRWADFDIRGPDAAAFVDRVYTFNFLKQPVGRTRYALLTDETGVIIDDGVACRLHDQHFYVTATTGAVDQVYRLMGFWNQQWRLDVDIANVTAAYAGINIAGPQARAVTRGWKPTSIFPPRRFRILPCAPVISPAFRFAC